jgi:hypothetical protein
MMWGRGVLKADNYGLQDIDSMLIEGGKYVGSESVHAEKNDRQ